MASSRVAWGSRIGIILAVSGSAVGLGNFLRFPGNAAENGGGAFLIPYFIAFLLLGIPIGWAEWTMGRYGGRKGMHSAPAIIGLWGRGPVARYLGSFGVLVPLVVYFYYVIVESWCLSYAWDYASGGLGITADEPVAQQVAESGAYFSESTGSNVDGFFVPGGVHRAVIFWGIAFAINLWFLYRGLSRGIEALCRWATPAMGGLTVIVLVRVLTLGTPDPSLPEQNVAAGLNFMWNPDFGALTDFRTWLAATGQIFFSLSVGFGVICVRRHDHADRRRRVPRHRGHPGQHGRHVQRGIRCVAGGVRKNAAGQLFRHGVVLHAFPCRDYQFAVDAAAGESLFRRSARHFAQGGYAPARRD